MAGIYYNKDLFEKYNIEVPKTLEDLEKACDTFLENGITPFTLANSTKWTGSMYFQCLAARKGGLEPFQKAADGTGSFEDESFEWAGEKIQEWVNKGYFPDGFNSMSEDDGQSRQLFYQETAAMYLIGSWATANLKTDSFRSRLSVIPMLILLFCAGLWETSLFPLTVKVKNWMLHLNWRAIFPVRKL